MVWLSVYSLICRWSVRFWRKRFWSHHTFFYTHVALYSYVTLHTNKGSLYLSVANTDGGEIIFKLELWFVCLGSKIQWSSATWSFWHYEKSIWRNLRNCSSQTPPPLLTWAIAPPPMLLHLISTWHICRRRFDSIDISEAESSVYSNSNNYYNS